MQLSREFVSLMGLVLLFLLAAFATEDARCVARARRAFEQIFMLTPAAIAHAEVAPSGEIFRFAALGGQSCLRPPEAGG
jgi:hypothetical protein